MYPTNWLAHNDFISFRCSIASSLVNVTLYQCPKNQIFRMLNQLWRTWFCLLKWPYSIFAKSKLAKENTRHTNYCILFRTLKFYLRNSLALTNCRFSVQCISELGTCVRPFYELIWLVTTDFTQIFQVYITGVEEPYDPRGYFHQHGGAIFQHRKMIIPIIKCGMKLFIHS